MLKAGLMAREYGRLPSEILGEHGLPDGKRFHLDYDVYAATSRHIEEVREEKREEYDPKSSRVGSPQERKNMIREQESRADQREQMQQAGMKAPSPEGQLSRLEELKQERQEAKQMREQAPVPDNAPERVDQDG
jgi:hypothetical protein